MYLEVCVFLVCMLFVYTHLAFFSLGPGDFPGGPVAKSRPPVQGT